LAINCRYECIYYIYARTDGVDAAAGSLQTDGRATRSGSVTISIYQSREVERVQLTALVVDKYDAR